MKPEHRPCKLQQKRLWKFLKRSMVPDPERSRGVNVSDDFKLVLPGGAPSRAPQESAALSMQNAMIGFKKKFPTVPTPRSTRRRKTPNVYKQTAYSFGRGRWDHHIERNAISGQVRRPRRQIVSTDRCGTTAPQLYWQQAGLAEADSEFAPFHHGRYDYCPNPLSAPTTTGRGNGFAVLSRASILNI